MLTKKCHPNIFTRDLSVLLAAVLLSTSGCTSFEVREVPDFVFSSRVLRFEQDGVIVGADPYFDSDQIEATFDVDLARGRYYPVRLRITNASEQRIVILREAISLVDSLGSVYASIPSDAVFEDLRHNSVAYGILGFGVFSFWSAESANAAMRADWAAKEISPSIFLGKGDSQTGFVFFRLPPEIPPQSTAIRLTATEFLGESESVLSFPFRGSATRPETETMPHR